MSNFAVYNDRRFSALVSNCITSNNKLTIPTTNDINVYPIQAEGSIAYDITTDTAYVSNGTVWVSLASVFVLPSPLQSIANLVTTGDEIIYTIASDVYATSPVSAAGRSFISLTNTMSQQTALGLLIGTDVQAYSSILDTIVNAPGLGDNNIIYTIAGNYVTSSLDPWARLNLLPANSASSARTALNLAYLPADPNGGNDLSSDIVVGEAASQTLTNKTINADGSNTLILGNTSSLAGISLSTAGAPSNGDVLAIDGGVGKWTTPAAGGDVLGPGANTINHIATWTGVNNTIADSNNVTLSSDTFSNVIGINMTGTGNLDLGTTGNINNVGDITSTGTISTSGNVSGTWNGSIIAVVRGGTGANNASSARTNLGLVIGTDVQAYDIALDNLSTLATTANKVVTTTGIDTYSTIDYGAAGANLLSQSTVLVDNILYTSANDTFTPTAITAHARTSLAETAGNEIVTETDVQTLSNKTISSTSNAVDLNGASFDGVIFSAASGTPGADFVLALSNGGTDPAWRAPIGNVIGSVSTDNAIVRYDGTTGRVLQNSGIVIDDSDNITGITSLDGTLTTPAQTNITSVGNLTSLNANGTINFNQSSGTTTLHEGATVPTGATLTLIDAPSANTDATNKAYVDAVASGGAPFASADLGTIVNINLASAPASIDGTAANNGDRILVKEQTTTSENGIYDYNSVGNAMTRSSDFDPGDVLQAGQTCFITSGVTDANTSWSLQATVNNVGVDPVIWMQTSGAQNLQAGNGMTQTGNVFNVIGSTTIVSDTNDIFVNSSTTANQILLSVGVVGNQATFGALPLNDSNAVSGILPIANGGTGANSLTANNLMRTNAAGTAIESIPVTSDGTTGNVVTDTGSQILTNKTFTDSSTEFQDDSDNTKKVQFELSNITTSTTRNISFPNADATLIGESTSQTLTNKTFSSATNILTLDDAGPIIALDGGAAPTNGDVLTVSGGNAVWQTPTGNPTEVTASAVIADNALVRGDGGARGVQSSGIAVDDTNNITGVNTLTAANITDGTASLTSGSLSSAVNITASGTITGNNITDGTASLTSGNLTDVTVGSGNANAIWDGTTIPVNRGGTGATSLTNNNFLQGNGVGAVTATKTVPSGAVVGTTDIQTLTNKTLSTNTTVHTDFTTFIDSANAFGVQLDTSSVNTSNKTLTVPNATDTLGLLNTSQTFTNKTITNSNNNVTARALFSNNGANTVSTFAAANPTAGQILTAVNSTTATWQTPTATGFMPARTLFVYQGAPNVSPEYSSLAAAITQANSLTPTATDHVTIQMFPGTFTESVPLVVPAFVTISTSSNIQGSTIIRPSIGGTPLFSLSGNTRLNGIIINGETFSGSGIYATIGIRSSGAASAIDSIASVTVNNCTSAGIQVVGSGATFSHILLCRTTTVQALAVGLVMTNGYEVTQGAIMAGYDFSASAFLGVGATLVNGYFVHDDFSYADISDIQASSCLNGIVVGTGTSSNNRDDYPRMRVVGASCGFIVSIGLWLREKSVIAASDFRVDDNTAIFPNQLHLRTDNPALPADSNLAEALWFNLRFDLFSFGGAANNLTEIVGANLNNTPGELQTQFTNEVSIGLPNRGAEIAVGGGDSYTTGMIVFRFDNGVGSTDITNDVKRIDGTSDLAFPAAPAANDALYIGGLSTFPLYPGIKITLTTPITVGAPQTVLDAVIWEFWNGVTWSPLNIMSTLSSAPYSKKGNITFGEGDVIATSLGYQYRFGDLSTWATTTSGPAGITLPGGVPDDLRYYIRARVTGTGTITTVPEIEQIKLHTNRTEINTDGFAEYFGKARPIKKEQIPYRSVIRTNTGNDPQTTNLAFTTAPSQIGIIPQNRNRYVNGVTDSMIIIWSPPFELDTSKPLTIKAYGSLRNAALAGQTIGVSIDYADAIPDTSVIVGQAGVVNTTSISSGIIAAPVPSGTSGLAFTVSIPLNISAMNVNTMSTWFKFTRFGADASDTYASDIYIHHFTIDYAAWANGEYSEN